MPESRLFVAKSLADRVRLDLERDQAHYVSRVLRKRVGDTLTLFDGRGREFPAVIETLGKNRAVLRVGDGQQRDVESTLTIRLLLSVSKGDRMDIAVQKATELGVAWIQPVVSERTVVRLGGERARRRAEHWQRVAASACEQCGRNRVPRVHEIVPLGEYLAKPSPAALKLVLTPGAESGIADRPAPDGNAVEVLVGPEGGLSDDEIEAAVRAGFLACHIGPRILRAETAGITALAVLQSAWGDL